MAVGDIFRTAIIGALNAQSVVNVQHWRQSTANSSGLSEVESLARGVDRSIVEQMALYQSNDVIYGAIESRTFNAPGVPISGYDLAISRAGGIESPACPPTVAVVVRKRTAYLGRKYRGRNYIAGIPVESVEVGQVNAGALSDWVDTAGLFSQSITWTTGGSPTFQPVIAALDGSVIVAPVGVRWNVIISSALDRVLRSQRRREIGVGA